MHRRKQYSVPGRTKEPELIDGKFGTLNWIIRIMWLTESHPDIRTGLPPASMCEVDATTSGSFWSETGAGKLANDANNTKNVSETLTMDHLFRLWSACCNPFTIEIVFPIIHFIKRFKHASVFGLHSNKATINSITQFLISCILCTKINSLVMFTLQQLQKAMGQGRGITPRVTCCNTRVKSWLKASRERAEGWSSLCSNCRRWMLRYTDLCKHTDRRFYLLLYCLFIYKVTPIW